MIKQIKRWGNSNVIILDKQDLIYLSADVGDLINMVDSFKVKKKITEEVKHDN